jgi:poly-gamma-glutamate synthesis protein (capsule biosynthesis protein)
MKINAPFDEFSMERPKDSNQLAPNIYYLKSQNITNDLPLCPSKFAYPFEKISSFLRSKDLVFVNLETPLTTHPRPNGLFISHPQYAQAMKDTGISIVAVANNHIYDAGEKGLLDTLCHLQSAAIPSVGAGENFKAAREGKLVQLRGMRLLFLGYTQFCNGRFASLAGDYPGILPLDRKLMIEDIKQARPKADALFVSLHWGLENQPNVHPKQVEIAHLLIDAGADCIIGHHPHVPHGIEIYKSKPIFYSLGNFIFPRYYSKWSDNFLAEIIIVQGKIAGVVLYPIAGIGRELFQPELLTGKRADLLLQELQLKSIVFNTAIAIRDHLGYIDLS